MKKHILEIKEYVSTHRQESVIIGVVLAVIVIASVLTIQATNRDNTNARNIEPTRLPTITTKKRPSPGPTEEQTPSPTKKPTNGPTIKPTNTPTPKATSAPTSQPATSTPVPTSTHTPTPTNTPTPLPPDTTPPSMMEMTGPADGSTIAFRGFCFPMKPVDDRSTYPQIKTQYKFDSSEWSSWGTEVSPCYSDVPDGQHTFSVQLKDEAGNVSSPISRTFTVDAE